MIEYITQAIQKIISGINLVKNLDDSRDPNEAGDIHETREELEYVPVTQNILSDRAKIPRKPRAKPIVSGKYGKQKGERIPQWRRRIINQYNELKHVKYNPESKFYTTAKINNFIKEIEAKEATVKSCEKCGLKHSIKSHDIAL